MSDEKLDHAFLIASKYWSKYRLPQLQSQGITVDSSNTFTFVDPNIPDKISQIIDSTNVPPPIICVPPSSYSYAKPILFIKAGTYIVQYFQTVEASDLDESTMSYSLNRLYVARAKEILGQFLKFSKFPDSPFEIDGDTIYESAITEIETVQESLRINRDEDFGNITDFRSQ